MANLLRKLIQEVIQEVSSEKRWKEQVKKIQELALKYRMIVTVDYESNWFDLAWIDRNRHQHYYGGGDLNVDDLTMTIDECFMYMQSTGHYSFDKKFGKRKHFDSGDQFQGIPWNGLDKDPDEV